MKRRTQKLADNCINTAIFQFFGKMTSILLTMKLAQRNNTILLSLFKK